MVVLVITLWNRSDYGVKLLDHFPFADYGDDHVFCDGTLTCMPKKKALFTLEGVQGWICNGGVARSFSLEFSDGSPLKFEVKVPAMGACSFNVPLNGSKHAGVAITWHGYNNEEKVYHVMLEVTNGGNQREGLSIPDYSFSYAVAVPAGIVLAPVAVALAPVGAGVTAGAAVVGVAVTGGLALRSVQ